MLFKSPKLQTLSNQVKEIVKVPFTYLSWIIQSTFILIHTYLMAWLMGRTDVFSFSQGIFLGFVLWLAFLSFVLVPMFIIHAFTFQYFLSSAIMTLLILLVMGASFGKSKE